METRKTKKSQQPEQTTEKNVEEVQQEIGDTIMKEPVRQTPVDMNELFERLERLRKEEMKIQKKQRNEDMEKLERMRKEETETRKEDMERLEREVEDHRKESKEYIDQVHGRITIVEEGLVQEVNTRRE
nr:protein enabled homolog [Leptinotarsa decemlineata]